MYEFLLSTVFQSITYKTSTISAYKMHVIRICHCSTICPFFFPREPDSYQLITFDPATEHRFYQLFITTAKQPDTPPPSSPLSNLITKRYCTVCYKAVTRRNVLISHVSPLGGLTGLKFHSFHCRFWMMDFRKHQGSGWK